LAVKTDLACDAKCKHAYALSNLFLIFRQESTHESTHE